MATKSTKRATKSAVKPKTSSSPQLTKSASIKNTKHDRTALRVFVCIILFFVFLYAFKGLFVVASVNGQPISRFDVIKQVEKQDGKQTLDSLVTKALITQEAKKRHIIVTQADVDGQVQKISQSLKAQGTSLDQAMAAQGMTRSQLNDGVTMQLYLQRMVGNNFKPSEKEIADYISANKSQFPEGTSESSMRTQAIAQLQQQKAQTATQQFVKDLQNNSKIIYFVSY